MTQEKPIVADDDEEDRMMIADAFEECRLRNRLVSVEDGEELMDYLYHHGKYAEPDKSPRPGLMAHDFNNL